MIVRDLASAIIVGILIIAGSLGLIANRLAEKDDALVEELCEQVVEDQLGLPSGSVDFSPSTPEN